MTQQDKADRFRALHHDQRVLVLPNAWDVASACLIEQAGAKAVATTSAGVAWSLGARDGDALSRDAAVAVVARIAAAVDVPVTADIEGGYAVAPEGVAETIRLVREAGAVGVNLEDAAHAGPGPLLAIAEHADRIAAARAAAGTGLFVNARIDVYLLGVGEPDTRLAHTLERAAAYVAAGADGVFVPGVDDPSAIATLAKEVGAPLNVMARHGYLPVPKLAELGVARVSVGPSITEVAYAATRRAAAELLSDGTYDSLAGGLTFPELQALLR